MKNLIKPFENISKRKRLLIGLGWLIALFAMWGVYGMGEKHM